MRMLWLSNRTFKSVNQLRWRLEQGVGTARREAIPLLRIRCYQACQSSSHAAKGGVLLPGTALLFSPKTPAQRIVTLQLGTIADDKHTSRPLPPSSMA